jgi:hypothetical protein
MLVETSRMIPITRLQKELTQGQYGSCPFQESLCTYILKNNSMEAVLLSYPEYEYLKNLGEVFEHHEINTMIDTRLKGDKPHTTICWEKIREEA